MKLVRDIGIKKSSDGRLYRFGVFICDSCKNECEKIKKDGIGAKYCSHKCYAENRKTRGAYNPSKKIINKKYIYIYMPNHPNAIGTRKLYVAEHRLVMEQAVGRYLTKNEVVHHIDENTLNNKVENLQIMTPSEHGKHHYNKRNKNNGKFTN
jgi:hypothetical protein